MSMNDLTSDMLTRILCGHNNAKQVNVISNKLNRGRGSLENEGYINSWCVEDGQPRPHPDRPEVRITWKRS